MKLILVLATLGLAGTAGTAAANHVPNCQITSADPSTYNTVDIPGVGTFYVEERDVPPPFDTTPPIPGSGFLLGGGTWVYEESNGVPGLQRGGSHGSACFPPPETTLPCLIITDDPINDQNCGHDGDQLIF